MKVIAACVLFILGMVFWSHRFLLGEIVVLVLMLWLYAEREK